MHLFNFAGPGLPSQSAALAYGVKSIDTFRVTSSFDIPAQTNITAYAMLSGTVLLQQQANDPKKVNLIIKPSDLKHFKVPVKYVIYRGLNTLDFIEKTNLADATNKVKTAGLELLTEMKTIQDKRSPGQPIPIKALFGFDLAPTNNERIDTFFFRNQGVTTSAQLFTIKVGTEIGHFTSGEIGIEIILENPEFFPTIELAKKVFDEINTNNITGAPAIKAAKETIRHYIDPAAFYGLHHDITGNIEYKDGNKNKKADTLTRIYDKILTPFDTKNTVYLDIRNENGYSYNYYDNYVNSELQIAQNPSKLVATEYYTNGWPIHLVNITPSNTANENEFSLTLRIDDNERPLIASRNIAPNLITVVDPPLANAAIQRIYFTDETHLLPTPIPVSLPGFTEIITYKIPNIPGTPGKQIATLVRLDYIKQLLPITTSNQFPKLNFTDYIFGPLNASLPFNTNDDKIIWHTTNHKTYIDVTSEGYVLGQYTTTILSVDTSTNEIEIFDEVPLDISKEVIIEYANGAQHSYSPISYTVANGKTKVLVSGSINSLQIANQLTLTIILDGILDVGISKFLIKNKNVVHLEAIHLGNRLDLYAFNSFLTSFNVDRVEYNGTHTEIFFSNIVSKVGFGGFVETGILVEDDATLVGGSDNDRVLLYATPVVGAHIDKVDRKKKKFSKGGKFKDKSFGDALELLLPGVSFDKTSLDFTSGIPVNTFAYVKKYQAKELLFMLGISKKEWEDAKVAANGQITTSLPFFRLLSTSGAKTDRDSNTYYEYDLQVTGKDNNGNFKVIDLGKKIYTTDKLVYVSKEFGKRFDIDTTLQMQVLDDFVYETLYQTGKNFQTDYNTIGKPQFEYSKEEELNLSSGEFWRQYTGGIENQKLFQLDVVVPPIAVTFTDKIVDFKDALDNIPQKKNEIKKLLQDTGEDLLKFAKEQIQMPNKPWTNKDGMLYLARLIMSVIIKNHPKITKYSANKVQKLLDEFEKHSRGLLGQGKPNFPIVTNNQFNILISGFDPFGAAFGGYKDWQGHQSNSSGNLALALDGEKVYDRNRTKEAVIKSVVFPVRFREFDEGWVEDFFKPYVMDQNIKMIITFSYGIEQSGSYDFEIERFAAKNRANGNDNNKKRNPNPPYFQSNDPVKKEFLSNQLPYNYPLSNSNKDTNMLIKDEVGLDQAIKFYYYKGNQRKSTPVINPFSGPHGILQVENPSATNLTNPLTNRQNPSYPTLIKDPNEFGLVSQGSTRKGYLPVGLDADRIQAQEGPGGDYLSNEIFYRVAYLRDREKSLGKPHVELTGHIHLGYLQGDPSDDRSKMFRDIKQAIENALNGF